MADVTGNGDQGANGAARPSTIGTWRTFSVASSHPCTALGAPAHAQRVYPMVDGTGLEQGRLTWLRRGWPDLFDELAAVLPRVRELL